MSEIFKTEFRGYNKQDVAYYIMTLNSQMEELKAQLDSKETELSRLRVRVSEAENANSADAENELRQKIYADAERELRVKLELELENKYKQDSEGGVYIIREELNALREKSAMYDEQKEMLAELMIKARTDAAEVMNDAEKRSAQLLEETFEKMARLEGDFREMKKNVMLSKSEMDTRLTTIRHYLDDFTQYIDLAERDISNTVENFKQNI